MESEKIKQPPIRITWGPVAAVIVTVLVYVLAQFLAVLFIYIYPVIKNWTTAQANVWLENSVVAQFFYIALVESITLLLLGLFLRWRKSSFRSLGLSRKPGWQDAGYALVGFGIYLPSLLLGLTAIKQLVPSLNLDQQQQIGFDTAASSGGLILIFISLVLLPPIVEEIICRGFLYQGLRRNLPKILAVVITSVLFALAHLQIGSGSPLLWAAAIDTFMLSLVLIYLRNATNALWAPIFLHILKNGIAFTILFVLKQ